MCVDDFADTLNSIIIDLPNSPSRLFWLRSFGLDSVVDWKTFLERFLSDYQDFREGISDGDRSFICSDSLDRLRHEMLKLANVPDNKSIATDQTSDTTVVEKNVGDDKESDLSPSNDVIQSKQEETSTNEPLYENIDAPVLSQDFTITRQQFASFCSK